MPALPSACTTTALKKGFSKANTAIQRGSSKQTLPLRIAKYNAVSLSAAWEAQGSEANPFLCIAFTEVISNCHGSGGNCKCCHLKKQLQDFLDLPVQKFCLITYKGTLSQFCKNWREPKHRQEPGSSFQQKIRPCVLQKQLV